MGMRIPLEEYTKSPEVVRPQGFSILFFDLGELRPKG
jgi:hypothetical protein